jgi:hypothetical protein
VRQYQSVVICYYHKTKRTCDNYSIGNDFFSSYSRTYVSPCLLQKRFWSPISMRLSVTAILLNRLAISAWPGADVLLSHLGFDPRYSRSMLNFSPAGDSEMKCEISKGRTPSLSGILISAPRLMSDSELNAFPRSAALETRVLPSQSRAFMYAPYSTSLSASYIFSIVGSFRRSANGLIHLCCDTTLGSALSVNRSETQSELKVEFNRSGEAIYYTIEVVHLTSCKVVSARNHISQLEPLHISRCTTGHPSLRENHDIFHPAESRQLTDNRSAIMADGGFSTGPSTLTTSEAFDKSTENSGCDFENIWPF